MKRFKLIRSKIKIIDVGKRIVSEKYGLIVGHVLSDDKKKRENKMFK
jgi:hypothetical protein